MVRPNPEEAMEQYLKESKEQGASTRQLANARHFLRQLMHALRETTDDGNSYRDATEKVIRIIPEDSHPIFLDIIRQFHPYWLGEAGISAPPPPPVSISSPQTGMAGALTRMDSDPWSRLNLATLERYLAHFRSLDHYAEALKAAGLSESNRQYRNRLMKLLSYSIRDDPISPESFRSGVDKVLALIRKQENWPLFVTVAREYYYFLANSPDASQHIQRQLTDAELATLINLP